MMASSEKLNNEIIVSLVKDGWRIAQALSALPFSLIENYEDESSAAAFVLERAGQQIAVVTKRIAAATEYPHIIRGIIEHYAQFKPSAGEVDVEVVIDEKTGHYELLHTGWANGYRIHGAVIHIDVRGDKIWIQHDGTEDGIAQQLLDAGIPRQRIVLAFKPPSLRKYMDFAVA